MIVQLDTADKRYRLRTMIQAKYARMLVELVQDYQWEERETWPTQVQEADRYLVNPDAYIPMITAMAANRGITVDLLVTKIKENDAAYRQLAGEILGLQQKELDEAGV